MPPYVSGVANYDIVYFVLMTKLSHI